MLLLPGLRPARTRPTRATRCGTAGGPGGFALTRPSRQRPEPGDSHDLIPLALRLIWDIDGVVDVVNRLGETTAAKEAATA